MFGAKRRIRRTLARRFKAHLRKCIAMIDAQVTSVRKFNHEHPELYAAQHDPNLHF